ncbi:zinc finger protein 862-like [Mercenaria mercenaria]|uniref:zinc finger protein 862-like n=1 Tax=Mercenaria mercenaria TaxID=6596 RepID=UPI00234E8B4F|nr:zinc finger protein 862-like [Mercenaria mercenaria]
MDARQHIFQMPTSFGHLKYYCGIRTIQINAKFGYSISGVIMSQLTLEKLGIKRKCVESCSNIENESETVCDSNQKKSKRIRTVWNDSWFRSFPWIEKVNENDNVKAMCSWCKLSKRTNSMATNGSPNLQSSTFSRHENTKDHLLAAEAHQAKKKNTTVKQVVETIAIRENELECDASKEAQVNTMYYIAKEGQPLNQYNKVLKLQVKNKCRDLQDPTKLYTGEDSKTELLDAINATLEEKIDQNIAQSEFIGLIIDESTDITVFKKLNVYVKCVDSANKSVIFFLDCINVPDGKADTIVCEIVKLFEKKKIPMSKLITLASDGASVMTGRKNGVGVKLKEYSPQLIQIHCVAHKLALAAGQACRDIPLLNDYQHTLKLIYRYFSNSAVRYNELRAMSDIMEDENIEFLTLKEPASFRWLSLEGAVRAILDCYPALYNTLEHDAAKGNPDAKGLLTKLKNVTFVLVSGFLKDVLYVVCKLSRVFQRDLIDVETVTLMIESTIMKLKQLKNVNGSELEKVYSSIQDDVYRGAKLTDREQLRMQFQNSSSQYLEQLIENIETRFDKQSMKSLQLLNVVFRPAGIPKNVTDLESHGESELRELCELYGGESGVIDSDRAVADYFQLKIILKSLNMSLSDACTHLLGNYRDVFPDFVRLATVLLVSPITSVACERGFSVHNKVKTKGRARLKHDTVTKLMRVIEEGPAIEVFDPKPAVVKFCEMKNRRK